MFDFDRVIDRRGTHATKWDNMAKLSGSGTALAIEPESMPPNEPLVTPFTLRYAPPVMG